LYREDCRAGFCRAFFRRHFSLFIGVMPTKRRNLSRGSIYFANADLLADPSLNTGSLARFVLCISAAHFG
jgi:hypothetical protein